MSSEIDSKPELTLADGSSGSGVERNSPAWSSPSQCVETPVSSLSAGCLRRPPPFPTSFDLLRARR
jgi:hypothetical protein